VTLGVGPRRHVGRRPEGTPASPYTAASIGRGRNSATGVRLTRAWSRSNGQDDPRRMVVVVRPEMAGNGIGGELSGGRSPGLHGHGDGRHGKARCGALRGPGSARSARGPSMRAEELGVREPDSHGGRRRSVLAGKLAGEEPEPREREGGSGAHRGAVGSGSGLGGGLERPGRRRRSRRPWMGKAARATTVELIGDDVVASEM
jgi:hypothetical protein